MRKQAQQQNQQQNQNQNQQETQQTQAQRTKIYFITFPEKICPEKAREIVAQLRKRFPLQTPIFMPRPPVGRKMVIEINGITVILTFPHPYNPKTTNKEQSPPNEEGFKLKDLIKKT